MAFVDTGATVYGGVNPGAPSGGGVGASANAAANVGFGSGSSGLGSGVSIKTWTLVYLGSIIAILFVTGYLFNGKGRK